MKWGNTCKNYRNSSMFRFATFLIQSRSPNHFQRYREDCLVFYIFHVFRLGMHRIHTREHHPHRFSHCPYKPRSSFSHRCSLRPSQSALIFTARRFCGGCDSHSSSRDLGSSHPHALSLSSHRNPAPHFPMVLNSLQKTFRKRIHHYWIRRLPHPIEASCKTSIESKHPQSRP